MSWWNSWNDFTSAITGATPEPGVCEDPPAPLGLAPSGATPSESVTPAETPASTNPENFVFYDTPLCTDTYTEQPPRSLDITPPSGHIRNICAMTSNDPFCESLPAQVGIDLTKVEEFRGTPYGTGTKGTYNCVTFVWECLETCGYADHVDATSQEDFKRQCMVVCKADQIPTLVAKNDTKIKGPVGAIANYGIGREITLPEAQPGDVIQYWYWGTNKDTGEKMLIGHAGIVEAVLPDGKIKLYGAHQSQGKVTTITMNPKNNYRTYVARPFVTIT